MGQQWTHCYRIRPYFRNLGFACTLFFVVIGLTSTLAAYFNIDGSFPRPKLAALIFCLFWSAWTFMGIWILLVYYKYRLLVSESRLRQIGVIRDDQAELEMVQELKWRRFPAGGSVRMSGLFGTIKIELGNFQPNEREHLISFLRTAIAETNQQGWSQFQEQFSDSPAKRKRARRAGVFLVLVFVGFAVAFALAWVIGLGPRHLVMSVVNTLMAMYLIRSHFRNCAKSEANDRVKQHVN